MPDMSNPRLRCRTRVGPGTETNGGAAGCAGRLRTWQTATYVRSLKRSSADSSLGLSVASPERFIARKVSRVSTRPLNSPDSGGAGIRIGIALFAALGFLALWRLPSRDEHPSSDGAHPAPQWIGEAGAISSDPSVVPREPSAHSADQQLESQRAAMESIPIRTSDDEYRLGRLRALKSAVEALREPARSRTDRVHEVALLATASVATILDARGLYRESPQGRVARVPRAEGCEAVLFNGRQYDVPHGAFPEFEQARALRRELEAESDAPRSLQEVGDLAEMDEVVQRVISRAMEAMRIVESDLESRLIHFR